MSFTEKQIMLRNGAHDLYYREYGKGDKKILMLHGNPGLCSDFDETAKALAEKGFCCIVPDRPGFGRNAAVPNFWNDGFIAMSLYTEIIEKLCGNSAYVAGYSLGSYYALRLAYTLGAKVKGVAMITPFVYSRDEEKASGLPKLAQNKYLGKVIDFLIPMLAKKKLADHFKRVYAPDLLDDAKIKELVSVHGKPDTVLSTMCDKNEFISFPLESVRLKKLTCPCVIISAKDDAVSFGTTHADKLKQSLKILYSETLEGGHAVIFTQGPKIAEIISKNIEPKENREEQNA